MSGGGSVVKIFCSRLFSINTIPYCKKSIQFQIQNRLYAAVPRRFYRKTGVLYSDGQFEITLDHRKLKTPRGNIFKVESEPLALAVAAEWDAQKTHIKQNTMHLSGLCSTAIDNPNNATKYDLVNSIVAFLDTDTVLFQSTEQDELYQLQLERWQPVLEWFCERYSVQLVASRDITMPAVTDETRATLRSHLLSYNMWAVHGFSFAVENLKSLILTLCCVDRHISVEEAVLLSRLEEEFQAGHWGRVEWAHDLSQLDSQARLAAAVLFIHFNSSTELSKSKQKFVV
ncbi:ATP synthase mitochondrial F1 complex assembly factor 2 [Bacillus rossius redtenbacheri]|uniref:ATP synthase mitochondrial F1 complex assembly factor 2 n=1 Tax=Bacillus rossius redtenbacheri TaxID=93214 RepID=UPI002FDE8355